MSVAEKLTAILNKANETTGGNATDLTQAVQTLCNGFGNKDGGGGITSINGRTFDCGTFSLEADATAGVTVQHSLGAVPSAVFLYIVDPPKTDESGTNIRYQYGKFRSDSSGSVNSAAISVANGSIAVSNGGGGGAYRVEWADSTITFASSSLYPLRAGLTYEWIALGGVQ